jgi:hypothetical protein
VLLSEQHDTGPPVLHPCAGPRPRADGGHHREGWSVPACAGRTGPGGSALTEQYGNNRVGADHGWLKARLRPTPGLKRYRSAARIAAGHALVQNLRRGHYELATDVSLPLRWRQHSASWHWPYNQLFFQTRRRYGAAVGEGPDPVPDPALAVEEVRRSAGDWCVRLRGRARRPCRPGGRRPRSPWRTGRTRPPRAARRRGRARRRSPGTGRGRPRRCPVRR